MKEKELIIIGAITIITVVMTISIAAVYIFDIIFSR